MIRIFKDIFGEFDVLTTIPTIKILRNENARRKEEEIDYNLFNKLTKKKLL